METLGSVPAQSERNKIQSRCGDGGWWLSALTPSLHQGQATTAQLNDLHNGIQLLVAEAVLEPSSLEPQHRLQPTPWIFPQIVNARADCAFH